MFFFLNVLLIINWGDKFISCLFICVFNDVLFWGIMLFWDEMIKLIGLLFVGLVLIKNVGILMGICLGGFCELIMIIVVIIVISIIINGIIFFIRLEFFIYYF